MHRSRKHASRKDDHILYSLLSASQYSRKTAWFEYVDLVHVAAPEIDFSDVSLSTEFLGFKLTAPLLIAGMTGGTPLAKKLNEIFARAAEELGVALGVGSQRVALESPETRETFSVVREVAVSVPVIANIGASQLVEGIGFDAVESLVEMVDADALAVHLNPLQEVLQPEGEARYAGLLKRLKELSERCSVPVLVKETGAGVSREAAAKLASAGVRGIDVGGAGGTSFAKVEGFRSLALGDELLYQLALDFSEWGVPTAASILEVRSVSPDLIVIATGGLRSGVDAAKALRLGADLCGFAQPVLRAAFEGGYEGVVRYLRRVVEGLRRALFLTGSRNLAEFKRAPAVVKGELREWIELRGLRVPGL